MLIMLTFVLLCCHSYSWILQFFVQQLLYVALPMWLAVWARPQSSRAVHSTCLLIQHVAFLLGDVQTTGNLYIIYVKYYNIIWCCKFCYKYIKSFQGNLTGPSVIVESQTVHFSNPIGTFSWLTFGTPSMISIPCACPEPDAKHLEITDLSMEESILSLLVLSSWLFENCAF